MEKKVIHTEKAPAAIGPYSQAIEAGGFVFISGQIAFEPASGELLLGDIETETKQVMTNLSAILTAAGLTFQNVVKSTIFLKDMNDFAKVNSIYGAYFTSDPPARETVQVAGLPRNVNVEISVIAKTN